MSAAKKRIPRNMARIEFLACRETIENLLAQGFDKRKAHTSLVESGQVTMSYDAFCKVLLKASTNKLTIQSISSLPESTPVERKPPVPVASPGSKIIKSSGREFPDPREMDPNESL